MLEVEVSERSSKPGWTWTIRLTLDHKMIVIANGTAVSQTAAQDDAENLLANGLVAAIRLGAETIA